MIETVRTPTSPTAPKPSGRWLSWPGVLRWLCMVVIAGALLQIVFALQILSLRWQSSPTSTSFQRSAIWGIIQDRTNTDWQHEPVPLSAISPNIQRAVIAAEDSLFFSHQGADWSAIRKAWERNAENDRILGGSTITQQLAKNLFLSGERSMLRKGQELLLAWMLEANLSKKQILEIYLNQVEWGQGIYGIEAASQHYFQQPARSLSREQAARLAVMLPQPLSLGQNPYSRYMEQRTRTIAQRLQSIELPGDVP